MPDFDVEAFVAKLESLGVKLTAVPLADGRMRINRWRMPHAVDAVQIESLWASQIGENQGRIDRLAAHLGLREGSGAQFGARSAGRSRGRGRRKIKRSGRRPPQLARFRFGHRFGRQKAMRN
jgi:hypothetical protein